MNWINFTPHKPPSMTLDRHYAAIPELFLINKTLLHKQFVCDVVVHVDIVLVSVLGEVGKEGKFI